MGTFVPSTLTSRSPCLVLWNTVNGAAASRAIFSTHCSLSMSGPIKNGRSTFLAIQSEIGATALAAFAGID